MPLLLAEFGVRPEVAVFEIDSGIPFINTKFAMTFNLPFLGSALSVSAAGAIRTSEAEAHGAKPRGFAAPELESGIADTLLTAAYYSRLVPVDITLPFGYHFGAFGISPFVQGYGSLGAGVEIDPNLYLGIEILLELGKVYDVPVRVGVNARIDPRSVSGFTPLEDIKIYASSVGVAGLITRYITDLSRGLRGRIAGRGDM